MGCLQINNLTVGYGSKIVLKNCSFAAQPKETLVIMGSSGGGKTTLLLAILGILKPIEGQIVLENRNITLLPIEARNIGYVPQDYALFPHMNVQENVSFGLRARGICKKERRAIATQMLHLANLPGFEERRMQELSGGEKQRVALARALAIQPHLLLLDEPLSNVDPITKFDVAVQLKDLFQKIRIPVIFVTHNREEALFFADRLAILADGNMGQIGPLQEVLQHPKTELVAKLLKPFFEK